MMIKTVNQIVGHVDHNGQSVPIEHGSETFRKAKSVKADDGQIVEVNRWKRDMYMTTQSSRSRIVLSDTDSVFIDLKGTSLYQILVERPSQFSKAFKTFDIIKRHVYTGLMGLAPKLEQGILTFDQLISECSLPNIKPILRAEVEEVVLTQFVSHAKKCYAKIEIKDFQGKAFHEVTGEVYASLFDSAGNMKASEVQTHLKTGRFALQIKGVQWTTVSDFMAGQIKSFFIDVLCSTKPEQIQAIREKKREDLLAQIQSAIDSGSYDQLEKFAARLRRSGKGSKCEALRTKWPQLTDNFVFVVQTRPLAGFSQKAGDLVLPVCAITERNCKTIDT